MTTPMLMTQHPAEELLAAFVDDRLDSAAREPVTEHLASCGECREIVLMATDFQATEKPDNVRHGNFGGRWVAAIASLAAAAAIALVVVPPMLAPDVDDLNAASRTLKIRPSDGRTASGFPYSEAPPPPKRGEPEEGDLSGGKAELYQLAAKLEDAKSPDPHAFGLSKLLIAEKRDEFNAAVTTLETAYDKTSGEEHDLAAVDLAAALIAQARFSGEKDYERALGLSNEVLKRQPKSPEALWNRAISLELLQRTPDALRAWDDYLTVDPASPWAGEAKDRKQKLERDLSDPLP